MKDLIELLERRAEELGDARLFTFLVDGEQQEQHVSFAELRAQARIIAGELQRVGAGGERALLLYPPGLDYIAAFFGCLYAGVIAVPVYPPDPTALDRTLPRLRSIAADAGASIILTTTPLRAMASAVLAAEQSFRWVTTDQLDAAIGDEWKPPALRSLAFLQYTSGTTGTPKGVMVTHANLLHNAALIADAFQVTRSSVGVIWLPPYHDMGLIGGIVAPLFLGMYNVLMSPLHFLQRPLRWLQAISRFGASASGGPNFAYELCIRKTTPEQRSALDLSSWRCAFNGAEPIRPETMARFADAFAPAGFDSTAFYPCYGLAETTLIATGGQRDDAPVTRRFDARALGQRRVVASPGGISLVGCGRSLGSELAIVDPDSLRGCGPDQIGEIWLAGPSVAAGYYRREAETAATFGAVRADDGSGPYLRTGDLGFVHDGELFVAGRHKDLLIVCGQNHYPQDIEQTVEAAHSAVRPGCCAVFGVDLDGEERVVVACEVDDRAATADEILDAIRRAVAATHNLAIHAIALLAPRSIAKTSSGKVQRHACRAAFIAGELKSIATWRAATAPSTGSNAGNAAAADLDRGALSRWLIERVSADTAIPPDQLDVSRSFAELGMSSAQIVSLTGDLELRLGRRVAPTLAYEYPSVERLARHLSGAPEPRVAPAPVRIPAAEPIAIVGIGCRFPAADGPEALWQLLREGRDAVCEPGAERARIAPAAANRRAGFVDDVDRFDHVLFRLSKREADAMDPQQRLLLTVAWRALEDAGQPVAPLRETATGVFVGISTSDYGRHHATGDVYAMTGNALSIAANRLSYFFDLRGPSLAVDTACSSSLVAIHLACQSLRSGESTVALAGGANLVLSDDLTSTLATAGFLAPDGRCKTFDARANGYVRGEGAGIVVLKPLSRAVADGDRIYALIRGSAVTSDGRSNGLTAPNGAAQEAVLRAAYADAQLDPASVDYIEAHGTGTALGDPIEARAIASVVTRGGGRCRLGSIKTNIGHLEAAAGIAGLIKTALALHHREIPPSLHFEAPNPAIPFDELGLSVQTESTPWPSDAPRAGVSSFGFGGTNAHVAMEAAPAADRPRELTADERPRILALSAHQPDAAAALRDHYVARLGELSWAEATAVAATRRDHLDHRVAVVARSADEAIAKLERAAIRPCRRDGRAPSVVFVFSGQGSQWPRFASGLFADPVFAETFERCERSFQAFASWSLRDALEADEAHSRMRRTEVAQPVLVAVQLGLAAMFRHRGVEPAAVIGHSLGEIAAAHTAGAISLDDAVRIAAHRGRLLEGARGRMLLIERPSSDVAPLIAELGGLAIAAENAPAETVVAGDPDQLAELRRMTACRDLPAEYAFHSPATERFQDALAARLHGLRPGAIAVPMISTVTGDVAVADSLGADYWRGQVREPVRFAAAVSRSIALGHRHFLELGVPVLGRSLAACGGTTVSALRRGADDDVATAEALAELYTWGADVAWSRVYPQPAPLVSLPPLPWAASRCWVEGSSRAAEVTEAPGRHPLLGRSLPLADGAAWIGEVDLRTQPYLADHRVDDIPVAPATLLLELVSAAAAARDPGHELSEVTLRRPLTLEARREVQVALATDPRGCERVRVFSRDGAGWREHAAATVTSRGPAPTSIDVAAIAARCPEIVSPAALRDDLARRGLRYGASFCGLVDLRRGSREALARVALPADLDPAPYRVHPALLDACAQTLAALDPGGRPFLPVAAARVRWLRPAAAAVWSWIRAVGAATFDLVVADDDGEPIVQVDGLRIRHLDALDRATASDRWLYQVQWQKRPLRSLPQARPPGAWVVLADDGGVSDALIARLEASGDRCTRVTDVPALAGALTSDRDLPLRGVINLWGADAHAPATVAELDAAAARVVEGALRAIQADVPVWLVTRGVHVAGDQPVAMVPAMLWGIGRTLAQERGDLLGGLVDLAPAATSAQAASVIARELFANDGERQVAYRDARYVARLTAAAEPPHDQIRCRADATYLITGGLGGIGLLVAHKLAERGARRLILMGRGGLPPRASWTGELPPRVAAQVAAVRELEARGVAVHLACVDVGDEAQLAGFLAAFRAEGWPPIRGVVHLAGVVHDRTLAKLEPSLLAEVFRAKVAGGWLLDSLLTEPLDFFAAFSSIASVLGSAGQAHYAAANAFLDALVQDRRRRGVPALAINWGPWAEVGIAAAAGRGDRLTRSGVMSIEPETGLELFGRLLAADVGQVAAVPVDWAELARSFPSVTRTPFLEQVAETAEPTPPPPPRRQTVDQPTLVDRLTREITRAIGASAPVGQDVPIDRLGIDSLLGIELRNRMEVELGIEIPIASLLGSPTIAQLAASLVSERVAPSPAPRATITAIREHGDKPPFYCIHPGALEASCYDSLARKLSGDRPVLAVRVPELEAAYEFDAAAADGAKLADIAAHCVTAVKAHQPAGPYLLGGWSLGGAIAFEVARELEKRGDRVTMVALFDTPPPGRAGIADDDPSLVSAFASYLGARHGHVFDWDDAWHELDRDAQLVQLLERAKADAVLPSTAELAQIEALFATYVRGLRSSTDRLVDYTPGRCAAPVAYFAATTALPAYERAFRDTIAWWRGRTSALELIETPGDHYTMFLPPNADALASELDRVLGAARA